MMLLIDWATTTIQEKIAAGFLSFPRVFLLLLLLSGCATGQPSVDKGNLALEQKNYDQAVIEYLTAVEKSPSNPEYRLKLARAKNQAAYYHKNKQRTN